MVGDNEKKILKEDKMGRRIRTYAMMHGLKGKVQHSYVIVYSQIQCLQNQLFRSS